MAGFLSLGGIGPRHDPRGQQGIGYERADQISASTYLEQRELLFATGSADNGRCAARENRLWKSPV
jgi:hypothetical protein